MNRKSLIAAAVILGLVLGVAAFILVDRSGNSDLEVIADRSTKDPVSATTLTPTTVESTTTSVADTTTTTGVPVRESGEVPGWTVGQPWGITTGLTMFRGNPTRTYLRHRAPLLGPNADVAVPRIRNVQFLVGRW